MDKWNLPPFKFESLPDSEIRTKWIEWKQGFEHVAAASGETNPTKLKSQLLALGSFELQRVFHRIPGADVQQDRNTNPYKVAIAKLDEYFAPKQHESFERYLFYTMKPESDETLEKFMMRLTHQAAKCNFGSSDVESREFSIVDRVILMANSDLREKLLAKEDLSLTQLTKIVKAHQAIKRQSKEMEAGGASGTKDDNLRDTERVNKIRSGQQKKTFSCTRCGGRNHDSKNPDCPAMGKRCNKCGGKNHFYSQCKSRETLKRKADVTQDEKPASKKAKVRAINEDFDEENFIFNIGDDDERIWCNVGGVLIRMIIDSGSKYNIIDQKTWVQMKNSGVRVSGMSTQCDKILKAYGQTTPLEIVGVFEATIAVKGSVINQVTKDLAGMQFPKIKGIKLIIPVDETILPKIQHVRRPPIALMDQVEEKLTELLRTDIIEEVNEPSAWVSPVVIVGKDKGDIRLCVDMRQVNKAIRRENHYMPTFEDFLPRLTSAKIFSRLDIKSAFHQVELDESSRHLTTFITHKGMYRFKRLMFGISCAPEMFQKIMEQMLSSCKNALNYIDDIIVFGASRSEHDMALENVMKTLRAHNVLLNGDKCIFRASEIVFLGHKISERGINLAEDKMISIKTFRAPQTKEEVRSFLGLVNYVGRFIPDCATLTFPLRQLIREDGGFHWENEHQNAFQKLKDVMATPDTLGFFNNDHRTRIVADASPVGLGAVLLQFEGRSDSNPKIISYASKSLTDTEKRYYQTEREALALVWAVERFSVYLIGRKFELETDHKPLEAIFKPTSKPCARIERWVLRMQAFDYTVVYRKGKSNIADPLSRLAIDKERKEFDEDDNGFVRSVLETAAIDFGEIETAAREDEELISVKKAMDTGDWSSDIVKGYQIFKNELGCAGETLVRGVKLVVPVKLRSRMLMLAHEGHPGESVMKRRLRDKVWWPGMDKDVLNIVKTCAGCRVVALPSKPEPMQRRPIPSGPWVDVALDFLGPLPSGEYLLVIVDYFSRYKEIEILTRITAKETCTRLEAIFVRLGFPRTVTVDNGRQFVSTEFEEFCKIRGIHLNNTTPYWPQENGEVERQNRSVLKRLKISQALNRDWKKDLKEYLLMYYTTPHTTTGKTPTELCIGRTIRGKIPSLTDMETSPPDMDFSEKDRILKHKGKENEDLKRGAKHNDIEIGDKVLMKTVISGNKLTPNFGSTEFKVIEKSGSRTKIQDVASKKIYERNSSHLKKVFQPLQDRQESSSSRPQRAVNIPAKLQDYVLKK
ncbi:uncharacterized protein K02A2.6-like [Phlebotomus papatasi]|uniref:uncharacterized protein K02A2.6-like n=1 Tax=Phlebotomus papatasi TaxID=29031 RepID=UPI002483F1FF|nr:uncharacterized protein K02A2.6-like [Phlebotomus papatasi]